MHEGTTTFVTDLGFGVVVVRNVPALVCERCGEAWYSDDTAAELELRVNEARTQRQQVAVFAMHG